MAQKGSEKFTSKPAVVAAANGFLDRGQHLQAVQVALIEHGIGPHGGMDRRVLAVALYEHVGGSVDVELERS